MFDKISFTSYLHRVLGVPSRHQRQSAGNLKASIPIVLDIVDNLILGVKEGLDIRLRKSLRFRN